jgi:predicted alpha/beta hydrolase family esterase
MKTAIIIHGYNDREEYLDTSRPSPSNDHWIPWIQRQLILKGIEAQAPEMPGFFDPKYEAWKEMLERFTPNEDTVLVGHSCGGGFLVRWLSETQTKVGKVILVAPWLDPDKVIDPHFFEFKIDPEIVGKTAALTIMYSTDDQQSVLSSIETLKSNLQGVEFQEFIDKGHFCLRDLKTEEFPELLVHLS